MTDYKLEQIVGNLLRIGVILAASVVLAGGVWYLASHGTAPVDYRHFQGGAMHFPPPLATVYIGLLLLIATPVARVAFTLAAFGLERDRAYVGITLAVLAILAFSLAGG